MSGKNVLLGLGIGIICSGVVLLVFGGRSSQELSDAEIKKRAEQLGMVEGREEAILTSELEEMENAGEDDNGANLSSERENDNIDGETKNTPSTEAEGEKEDSVKVQGTQKKTGNDGSATSDKTKDADSKNQGGTKTNHTETTSETKTGNKSKTKNPDKNNTKKKNKKNKKTAGDSDADGDMVTVKIESGMTAGDICRKLEDKGLVKDAEDFENYLVKKNIQYKLRAGTYEILDGADYEAIIGEIYKG